MGKFCRRPDLRYERARHAPRSSIHRDCHKTLERLSAANAAKIELRKHRKRMSAELTAKAALMIRFCDTAEEL